MGRKADQITGKTVKEGNRHYGYSSYQLAVTGDYISRLLTRNWFDGLFDNAAQPYMARLLLGVVLCSESGMLATKRQALRYMNAAHGKTAQRYIRLAQEKGLLTVSQSTIDQRVDLLCPTEALLRLVMRELTKATHELRFAAQALMSEVQIIGDSNLPPLSAEDEENPFTNPAEEISKALSTYSPIPLNSQPHRKRGIAQYTETIRLMPTNVVAYLRRAFLYAEEGAHDQAVADYTEVIRLHPTNAGPVQARALYYALHGQYEQAVVDYGEAIRLSPNDYTNYANRGRIFLTNLHDFERAVEDFSEAIRCQLDRSSSHELDMLYIDRAHANEKLGNCKRAIADLRAALEVRPDNRDLKEELSNLLVRDDAEVTLNHQDGDK
jgi:tetratricopeptide (TPR) repeat protein